MKFPAPGGFVHPTDFQVSRGTRLYWGCLTENILSGRDDGKYGNTIDDVTDDSVELGSRGVGGRVECWGESHVEHSVTLDLTVPRVVSVKEEYFL